MGHAIYNDPITNTNKQPFPSATAQEVALSVLRHALARFPRLLLRFGMGRKRSTGALGCLSRLVEYVLLEHTNAAGMLLAPPPQPDKCVWIRSVPCLSFLFLDVCLCVHAEKGD